MALFNKKEVSALSAAQETLAARTELLASIQTEGIALGALIHKRVAGERALVAAETAEATGQPADTAAASKALDSIKSQIGRQAARLAGFRHAIVAQAPALAAIRNDTKSNLPPHAEALRDAFAAEWSKASQAWGTALGKRAELEKLVGKMTLPEPQPAVIDLPDSASAPYRVVEQAEGAIEAISGAGVFAMELGSKVPFDADAVWIVTDGHAGYPVGALLVEASCHPGELRLLARIGYAQTLASQEAAIALCEATNARNQFAREAQADSVRVQDEAEKSLMAPVRAEQDRLAESRRNSVFVDRSENPYNAVQEAQLNRQLQERQERDRLKPSNDPSVKIALGR